MDSERLKEVLDKSCDDMYGNNSAIWWRGYDYANVTFLHWLKSYMFEGREIHGLMADEELEKIRRWIVEHR